MKNYEVMEINAPDFPTVRFVSAKSASDAVKIAFGFKAKREGSNDIHFGCLSHPEPPGLTVLGGERRK